MQEEDEALMDAGAVDRVQLLVPKDQEELDLWKKKTVFDPVSGTEVHKATVVRMINAGCR